MLTSLSLRIGVLCSRRAPGLAHLLARAENRAIDGPRWQIVCCVTSDEEFCEASLVEQHGVPLVRHPLRTFRDQRHPGRPLRDSRMREEYDEEMARLLADWDVDVVLLAGYLLLLTPPMLDAFPARIVNVHHSDLRLRNTAGGPKYAGLRAVRDAILAGERETRSTAHLVTATLDAGPLLLRSEPFVVPAVAHWARDVGADDVLRKAVWAHEEWMLRSAFGPLMERVLDRIAGMADAPHVWEVAS